MARVEKVEERVIGFNLHLDEIEIDLIISALGQVTNSFETGSCKVMEIVKDFYQKCSNARGTVSSLVYGNLTLANGLDCKYGVK